VTRIVGTSSSDDIRGAGGKDTVILGAGRDIARGYGSSDTLYGGDGNDHLFGGAGSDRYHGGFGDDFIFDSGGGHDTIYAGPGDDEVRTYSGDDTVQGGSGNDWVLGGAGNDSLRGGMNDDTLYGGAGDDLLMGDKGSDVVFGGDGDDVIIETLAIGDDDVINETAGYNSLYGGAGNDTIVGGAGPDTVYGGENDADVVLLYSEVPTFGEEDSLVSVQGFGHDFASIDFSDYLSCALQATTDDGTLVDVAVRHIVEGDPDALVETEDGLFVFDFDAISLRYFGTDPEGDNVLTIEAPGMTRDEVAGRFFSQADADVGQDMDDGSVTFERPVLLADGELWT
jgi:Ca2+-binding RTX toxin-like protein